MATCCAIAAAAWRRYAFMSPLLRTLEGIGKFDLKCEVLRLQCERVLTQSFLLPICNAVAQFSVGICYVNVVDCHTTGCQHRSEIPFPVSVVSIDRILWYPGVFGPNSVFFRLCDTHLIQDHSDTILEGCRQRSTAMYSQIESFLHIWVYLLLSSPGKCTWLVENCPPPQN